LNPLFLKKADQYLGSILVKLLPASVMLKGGVPLSPRFLLIRPGGIGDAVLLCPAICTIKSVYSASRIDVLAEVRNSSIFKLCPEVETIYRYDRLGELSSCMKNFYDVVIDTEQWHRLSAVVSRLVRADLRVGFATNERRRMFHQQVRYSHDDYEAACFFRLLDFIEVKQRAVPSSCLVVPKEVRRLVGDLVPAGQNRLVVFFPGASIAERRWGLEKFRALAGRLAHNGFSVVVVGGREDQAAGEFIAGGGDALNRAGQTTLVESAAIIDQSSLLVSGDSGILHVGVGLGKPTVSLFGPGIAQKWAPRGENHIVINKKLTCSPCTKFGSTPKCPIDAKCMKDISIDEVFEAVMALLERTQDQKAN